MTTGTSISNIEARRELSRFHGRCGCMLQPLKDIYITLHPLLPSIRSGSEIHPLLQCQFNFYVDRNLDRLLTRIDAEGFKVYRIGVENIEGKYPKIPSSEMGSLFGSFFTELLMNLAGSKRWVCRTEGLNPPPARKVVGYPFDRDGLISKREKDRSAITLASKKSLQRLIRRSWQRPLIEVAFFLPVDQILPVVSLLQKRSYTATTVMKLLDYCDPIVAKDSDGFSLCFLSKKDAVVLSKECDLEEVNRRFRRHIDEGLKEFEQAVTPYWEGVVDRAERFWNRLRQGLLRGEEGWQRIVSRWQETERITGFLISEELLGARLDAGNLLRLFYELQCERATVWAMLRIDIPTLIVRDMWFDEVFIGTESG